MFAGVMAVIAFGQQTINGTVTDAETGETLPGVTVMVKGKGNVGTITNFDGYYELKDNNPEQKILTPEDVLVFSFVGFAPQEVTIGAQSTIDVALELDISELEEVVVIGYGVQKKKVVTGAIESISTEEITQTPVVSATQALQGRAAGVQMTNQSGQPGDQPNIIIRGIGTNGDATPLYLVDGMAVNSIDNLNPADIKSMEVLKDAASTAIYGARAANGVVLITTKSGNKGGKFSMTYSGYYGIQNAAKTVDLLNADEYQQIMAQAGANSLTGDPIDPNQVPVNNTDWQNELYAKNVPMQSHYIGVEGGTEKSSFTSSISYFDQEGIVGGSRSKFERYTARLNSRTDINDYISWGNNLTVTHLETRGVTSNGAFNGAIGSALNLDPLTPVYETDQNILSQVPYSAEPVVTNGAGDVYGISNYVGGEIVNPMARLELQNGVGKRDQVVGNIFVEAKPIEGLTLKSTFGTDVMFGEGKGYTPLYYLTSTTNNIVATNANQSYYRVSTIQWENTAMYQKQFGPHKFNFMVGTGMIDRDNRSMGGGGQGVNTDNPDLIYLDLTVDSTQRVGSSASEYRLGSIFSRLLYDYNERISIALTQRRDGSSNFGPSNKFGNFYSVGASWVINEEPFFPKWKELSLLKLRASWGQNGNDRIGQFRYAQTVNYNIAYNYNNGAALGSSPGLFASSNVHWESADQIDIAVDLGLFNNQLTATVDYYKKTTRDLLQVPVFEATLGLDAGENNVGEMLNEGVEITTQWRSSKGDFKYSIEVNATHNKNTATRVENGTNNFLPGASAGLRGEVTRLVEGEPVVSFYGFKTDGIFQSQADVFAHINAEGDPIQPSAVPGDIRFVDVNGDGRISDDDRTVIGSPLPDWTVGSTINMSYKGIDFAALFTGVFGVDLYNAMNRPDIYTSNRQDWIMDSWTEDNPSNTIPRFIVNDPNKNYTRSTDMLNIENGSYLRLKNIQIGYTFPSYFLERMKSSHWRVYVSADNLLTLTGYSGADPEVGTIASDGNIYILDTGIDRGIYPQARTFRIGTSITF